MSLPSKMGSLKSWSWRAPLGALALVLMGLRSAHSWHRWLDDAYITFRHARNMADGHGMVFNPGHAVEGLTNLGWAFVLLPWAGGDMLLPARVLSLVAMALTVVVLLRWTAAQSLGWVATACALAPLALSPWLPFAATQGLETAAVTLLVTLAWTHYRSELEGGWPVASVALALAPAFRPDAALLALLIGAWHLLRRGGPRVNAAVIRAVAIVLIGAGALIAFKLVSYGSVLPNTFHAKTSPWPWWRGGQYALSFLQAPSPLFGGGLVVSLLAGLGWGLRREDRALPALVALAWLAMVVAVNGDFFSNYRLLVPVLPAMAAAIGLAVQRAMDTRLPTAAVGAAALLYTGAATAPLAGVFEVHQVADHRAFPISSARVTMREQSLFTPWKARSWGRGLQDQWVFAAAWTLTHAPEDQAVGMTDIGLVSYITQNPIIDMLGLTEPAFIQGADADRMAQQDRLRDGTHLLIMDRGMPRFQDWRGWLEHQGWSARAGCGPLVVLANPALVKDDALPTPEQALQRAHRAIDRAPDMPGLHVVLAWMLKERGVGDPELGAYLDAATLAGPPGVADTYLHLRCALGLTPGCEEQPTRCNRSQVLLQGGAETQQALGWGEAQVGAEECANLRAAGVQAWGELAVALRESDMQEQAVIVDEMGALGGVNHRTWWKAAHGVDDSLKGLPLSLDGVRQKAIQATDQAWVACRASRHRQRGPKGGKPRQR